MSIILLLCYIVLLFIFRPICQSGQYANWLASRFANRTTNLKTIFEVCFLSVKHMQCYLSHTLLLFKRMACTEVSRIEC